MPPETSKAADQKPGCQHDDAERLHAGPLSEEEIEVILEMRSEGKCPVCELTPEVFGEYAQRVEAARKGGGTGAVEA